MTTVLQTFSPNFLSLQIFFFRLSIIPPPLPVRYLWGSLFGSLAHRSGVPAGILLSLADHRCTQAVLIPLLS